MKKKKFCNMLMALVAMSFFSPTLSLAQTVNNEPRAFSPKIKTPNTNAEFKEDVSSKTFRTAAEPEERETLSSRPTSSASRKVQQHGVGIGLGQTFPLGNYSNHGDSKITMDLLYSYAASYSFDLLVDAHLSQHSNESEQLKLAGLAASFKARFVEYDNFSPYFLGGLGFYAPRAKRVVNGNRIWTEQKVTFGPNFGGGADLRLNDHYVVGIMGQLHWPFRVEQDGQPDLKGYYFKLLITGMYLF